MKYLILLLIVLSSLFAREPTKLIEVPISEHDAVYDFYDFTIVNVNDNSIRLLVQEEDLERLKKFGHEYEVLIDDYESYIADLKVKGKYHSYDELDSILNYYAQQYPDICCLDTISYSVQGRCLFSMKISDNPVLEEDEAEMRLIGNMHGDEMIGCEVPLYFLRYLLDNYDSNPFIKGLVDSIEYTIIPMLNPDGHELNQRYNANGVDLNRDCGYMWNATGSSPGPFSQPETECCVENNYVNNNIAVEYNYHSVAQYVNYPWDYHYHDPPDSQYILFLSQIYADSADLSPINGYEWYQVHGSLQDASIGNLGILAWTIETLQPANSSQIDQICIENKNALLAISERTKWGVSGYVTDSVTGDPLWARVKVVSPERWNCYTDTMLGDYHKMLPSGNYDILFWAPGYEAKRINNINIPGQGEIQVDCALAPDSTQYYGFQILITRYRDHAEDGNKTQPHDALYAPDGVYFSLGRNGYIVIDMQHPIRDGPGDDFTVYEGDAGSEGYYVYVTDDWSGSWHNLGYGEGTQSFDLGSVSSARYVRINDDGDTSSSGQYAGYDLDAIESNYIMPEIDKPVAVDPIGDFQLGPNPAAKIDLSYCLTQPCPVDIKLYDAAGRVVVGLDQGFRQAGRHQLKVTTEDLSAGVYFLRFNTPDIKISKKIVVIK